MALRLNLYFSDTSGAKHCEPVLRPLFQTESQFNFFDHHLLSFRGGFLFMRESSLV